MDRSSEFALVAEFRSMSCQNFTEIYTNSKILKRRRKCVFRGEVKQTLITVCEALVNALTLIVSREDVLSGL